MVLFLNFLQSYGDLGLRRLTKPSNKLYFSSKMQKIKHFCLIFCIFSL